VDLFSEKGEGDEEKIAEKTLPSMFPKNIERGNYQDNIDSELY